MYGLAKGHRGREIWLYHVVEMWAENSKQGISSQPERQRKDEKRLTSRGGGMGIL